MEPIPLGPIYIEDLELSIRSYNCLRNNGINTIAELMRWSPAQLMHIKNLGDRSLREIVGVLKVHHLTLNEHDDGLYRPIAPILTLEERLEKLTSEVELLVANCRSLRTEVEIARQFAANNESADRSESA